MSEHKSEHKSETTASYSQDEIDAMIKASDDSCPNCGGLGIVAGCFEDTCSGADCDPEDADFCCAPMRCDWCKEKSK